MRSHLRSQKRHCCADSSLYGDAFAIAKAIAQRWPQWAKIAERRSVSCSLTDLRFATRRSAVRRVKNGRRNSRKGPGRSVFAPLVSKGSARKRCGSPEMAARNHFGASGSVFARSPCLPMARKRCAPAPFGCSGGHFEAAEQLMAAILAPSFCEGRAQKWLPSAGRQVQNGRRNS